MIDNALSDSDDLISELEERELYIGDDEYKITGRFIKKELLIFREKIISKMLNENWDADDDLEEMIQAYLPSIKLKVVDFFDP